MEYIRLVVGATNSYILYKGEDALIIDPGSHGDKIIQTVKAKGFKVKAILLTHAHGDHIGALNQVREEFNAPVYMHRDEEIIYDNEQYNFLPYMGGQVPDKKVDFLLEDGQSLELPIGDIRVLHTPGHTPGSVCYLIEDIIVTGDTLFQGSIGRTDLPLGNWDKMKSSLALFFTLDDSLIVLSGHGEESQLSVEKKFNPFLNQLA